MPIRCNGTWAIPLSCRGKHLTQGNAILLGFLPEFLVNNDPLKRGATWFWRLCEQEDIKRLQQRAAVLPAAARVPQSLSPPFSHTIVRL